MSDQTTTDPGAELEARFAALVAQLQDLAALVHPGARAAIPATGLIPDVVDGQLIETAWGNAVAGAQGRVVHRFDNYAQVKAQWTAPPDGAVCVTVDDGRLYVRRAGRWYTRASGTIASIASDSGATINVTAALVGLDGIVGGTVDAGFNADKTTWAFGQARYNASAPGSIQVALFKCSTATGGTLAMAVSTTITTLSYDVYGYRL